MLNDMETTDYPKMNDSAVKRAALAFPLLLSEAVKAVGGTSTLRDRVIRGIATDSRFCLEDDLFFCLDGSRTSGEDFARSAAERGAIPISSTPRPYGVLVGNPLFALLALSAFYVKRFSEKMKIIMITGSCGKTTTKDFLKTILSEKYSVCATEKNFNNAIGLPMTAFAIDKSTEYLILEAGMNHPGELSAYSHAFSPDLAMILNVGNAHIGNFGNREEIAKAKMEIFSGMRKDARRLIPFGEPLLAKTDGTKTVGLSDSADYACNVLIQRSALSICSFSFENTVMDSLVLPFAGRDMITCFSFATAASVEIGADLDGIRAGITKLKTPNRRIPTLAFDRLFLNDSYNASPESVIAALSVLDLYPKTETSVLLGDMEELGDASEYFHRLVGREIRNHSIKSLFLFGSKAKDIAEGAKDGGFPKERIYWVGNLNDFDLMAELLLDHTSKGELILCKASHRVRLGEVIERLKVQSTFEK